MRSGHDSTPKDSRDMRALNYDTLVTTLETISLKRTYGNQSPSGPIRSTCGSTNPCTLRLVAPRHDKQ